MSKKALVFNKICTEIRNGSDKKSLQRAITFPAGHHDGCTAWRFDWVREGLNYNRKAIVDMSTIPPVVAVPHNKKLKVNELFTVIDAMVVQRPVSVHSSALFTQYNHVREQLHKERNKHFRLIVDIDDVLHYDYIARYNTGRKGYVGNHRFDIFSECVKFGDELHVCSPTMKDFYLDHIDFNNITYRPNLMPRHLFDQYDKDRLVKSFDINSKKPRILWAGSWSHIDVENIHTSDDFTLIKDAVLASIDDYQWIFYGAHPMWVHELITEGKVEYIEWGSIVDFPKKVISLDPNIIIAPLEDNVFNKCKSNIKLTETGAFGIAGVFQDIDPYDDAPLKFTTGDELLDQIKYLLSDIDIYLDVVDKMRYISEEFYIENNLELLHASYFTEINSPDRQIRSPKLQEIQSITFNRRRSDRHKT